MFVVFYLILRVYLNDSRSQWNNVPSTCSELVYIERLSFRSVNKCNGQLYFILICENWALSELSTPFESVRLVD